MGENGKRGLEKCLVLVWYICLSRLRSQEKKLKSQIAGWMVGIKQAFLQLERTHFGSVNYAQQLRMVEGLKGGDGVNCDRSQDWWAYWLPRRNSADEPRWVIFQMGGGWLVHFWWIWRMPALPLPAIQQCNALRTATIVCIQHLGTDPFA